MKNKSPPRYYMWQQSLMIQLANHVITKGHTMLTNIIAIKKDGSREQFNITKMIAAINKAAKDVNVVFTDSDIQQLNQSINAHLNNRDVLIPQDLHAIAIQASKEVNPLVSQSYVDFHNKKQTTKSKNLYSLKVVQKDGRIEDFDDNQIYQAVQAAAKNTERPVSDDEFKDILNAIAHYNKAFDLVHTSTMHHLVMGALHIVRPDIYRSYKRYYQQRRNEADAFHQIMEEANNLKFGSYNENANKDSQVITTKSALINEQTMKRLFRTIAPEYIVKAHDEGWVYNHDEGDLYKDTFNCDLFDMGNLMKNKEHDDGVYAFKINNKTTYEPKHVSSAFDILSSATIAASGNQFGGFTVNEVDRILSPYAQKSYDFYIKEAEKYQIPDKEKYAEDKTLKEIAQGVQSYTYELAQTQNALGQTPFTTISFGLDVSHWGREVTKAFLTDRMRPDNFDVFPKLVFNYRDDVNGLPDSPNYDLYKLSLECSSKKLYPDYLSLNYYGDEQHYRRDVYERSGKVIAPMGCRAHLSPYIDPKTGEDVVNGRFNIGAVSINPVKIALESYDENGNFNQETFEQLTEKYANLIFDFLNWRYERVGMLKGSSNPLFWCEGGAWRRIKPDQRVRDSDLLDSATASIGYCGLYEMVNAKHKNDWRDITPEQRHKEQKDFLEHINRIREQRIKMDNHPYALYSTPKKSLWALVW